MELEIHSLQTKIELANLNPQEKFDEMDEIKRQSWLGALENLRREMESLRNRLLHKNAQITQK